MTQKMRDFIYQYWSKSRLGQEMIKSDYVSDSDLWFLIPNNVKIMHGFPVTRTFGKRKTYIKKNKKKLIESFRFFDIVSDIIDDILIKPFENNEFIEQFVEFKNVDIGDKQRLLLNNIIDNMIEYNGKIFKRK